MSPGYPVAISDSSLKAQVDRERQLDDTVVVKVVRGMRSWRNREAGGRSVVHVAHAVRCDPSQAWPILTCYSRGAGSKREGHHHEQKVVAGVALSMRLGAGLGMEERQAAPFCDRCTVEEGETADRVELQKIAVSRRDKERGRRGCLRMDVGSAGEGASYLCTKLRRS